MSEALATSTHTRTHKTLTRTYHLTHSISRTHSKARKSRRKDQRAIGVSQELCLPLRHGRPRVVLVLIFAVDDDRRRGRGGLGHGAQYSAFT